MILWFLMLDPFFTKNEVFKNLWVLKNNMHTYCDMPKAPVGLKQCLTVKPVNLSIVELHLSESISMSTEHSTGLNSLATYWMHFGSY